MTLAGFYDFLYFMTVWEACYGCQIWAQKQTVFNRKVHTSQNKAVRILTFSHVRASGKPIYGQLKILKLEDQIFLQNCLPSVGATSDIFGSFLKNNMEAID